MYDVLQVKRSQPEPSGPGLSVARGRDATGGAGSIHPRTELYMVWQVTWLLADTDYITRLHALELLWKPGRTCGTTLVDQYRVGTQVMLRVGAGIAPNRDRGHGTKVKN